MRCSVTRTIEAMQFLQAQPEKVGFPTGRGLLIRFEGLDRLHFNQPLRSTDTVELSQTEVLKIQARLRRATFGSGSVRVPGKDGQVMIVTRRAS